VSIGTVGECVKTKTQYTCEYVRKAKGNCHLSFVIFVTRISQNQLSDSLANLDIFEFVCDGEA